MTTGNLRTAALNAYEAVIDHNAVAGRRARQFGTVILAFALGAAGGGELTMVVGTRAVWLGAALLLLGLGLFIHEERIAAR